MGTVTYTATGTYESYGDIDWFKFHLIAGNSYVLSGGVPSGGQSVLLQVYDPSGHLINVPVPFGNFVDFIAPTTGDYFMSANGVGSPTGFYQISVLDRGLIAIPGWINTPASLTVGTSVHISGAIDGQSRDEWYGVDLVAGQSYVLAASTINQSTVYIADAAGHVLFNDSSNVVHFTAPTTGHYFAGYNYPFDGGQGYDIKISVDADDHPDNPTAAGAGALTLGTAATGLFESGGDTDWYAVTLQAGSSYDLSVTSSDPTGRASPYLGIADASGTIVYSGSASAMRFSPTSTGTYYLAANARTVPLVDPVNTNANDVSWQYSLSATLNATDLTDNILTTGQLTVGVTTSSNWSANDDDWFRITLTQGQAYTFTTSVASNNAGTLALYDAAGHIVPVTANTYGSTLHHTAETSGTYYVAMHWTGISGSYGLRADTVSDDFADNASTTGRVTVGGPSATGNYETLGDRDWFAVDLVANRAYALTGGASAIRDAAGNALNTGSTFTPTVSGTYYLEAYIGGQTGTYSVGITTQTDDFTDNVNTTGLVRLNYTGDGTDETFDAGVYAAILNGNAGNDTLLGSDQADTINGGDGNDTLYGRGGNDIINGGIGDDAMAGGLGNDVYTVDSANDLVFENANEGTDRINSGISFYLYANVENLTLTGSANIYGVGNELDNTIAGNTGDNTLLGGLGNDTIRGGSGVDILYGEGGNDMLFGDAGNDFLAGGQGDDVMDGGTGGDSLYGEDGNDTLTGGTDFVFDQLVGGNGNDILHGDSGLADYDYLYGNAGDDSFYVDTGDDLTFEQAGEGIDTVYATVPGSNNGVYLYANIENLVLLGTTAFGVGNELANVITGNAIGNTLLGGDGNDTINGLGGNDILFGQAGADTFVFGHGTGVDTVGDFVAGTDKIDLTAIGYSWAQVQNSLHEVNGNTAIDLGGGDVVILNGVTVAQLHQSDFVLSGGGGSLPEPAAAVAVEPVEATAWYHMPWSNDAVKMMPAF